MEDGRVSQRLRLRFQRGRPVSRRSRCANDRSGLSLGRWLLQGWRRDASNPARGQGLGDRRLESVPHRAWPLRSGLFTAEVARERWRPGPGDPTAARTCLNAEMKMPRTTVLQAIAESEVTQILSGL